jgi:hypothetical protein
MDCEKCQELLSDYIDGDLAFEERRLLSAHLEECLDCYSIRQDLEALVSFCEEHRGEYDPVPNSRAMWVRIRNAVEVERRADAVGVAVSSMDNRSGLWARLTSARLQLSFAQLAATVSVIAIVVSILTSAGLQRLKSSSSDPLQADLGMTRFGTTGPKINPDDRIRQQQIAISYWYDRVAQRKARWSPQVRDAFDRNITALDRAVDESKQQLMQNPHDEVSEEMLNAALNEKMELLKDFSEQ